MHCLIPEFLVVWNENLRFAKKIKKSDLIDAIGIGRVGEKAVSNIMVPLGSGNHQ